MKVLIACEESQIICKAFRAKGHEAFSCDLQDCSGGLPQWHIKDNVLNVLNDGWDLMIAHPPCTYTGRVSIRYMDRPGRFLLQDQAIDFFLKLKNAPIKKKCLENPVPQKRVRERVGFWNQIIQPYYFGDPHVKTTCLWLFGLSRLQGLEEVAMNPQRYKPEPMGYNKRGSPYYFCGIKSGIDQAKQRSKTFPGIAQAMAQQWG